MQQKDILDYVSLVLAAWGAILSTLLAVVKLQQDRKRLHILLDLPRIINRGEEKVDTELGRLTITNKSHRPITISEASVTLLSNTFKNVSWAAKWNPKSKGIDTDLAFPKTLGDGQSISLPIPRDIAFENRSLITRVAVLVRDSEGKLHGNYEKGHNWEYYPRYRRMGFRWWDVAWRYIRND